MDSNYGMSVPEFVDIHGRDIRVELSESGEILIPLSEIRQTGFNIYHKSKYNKFLVDDSLVKQEFNMCLLDAAKTYFLNNKFRFGEHEILESINNCKKMLTENMQSSARSNFLRDHHVKDSPDQNIQITTRQNAAQSSLTVQNLSNFNRQSPNRSFDSDSKSDDKTMENRPNSNFDNPRRSFELNKSKPDHSANRRPFKSDQFEQRRDNDQQSRPKNSNGSVNGNNQQQFRQKNKDDINSNNQMNGGIEKARRVWTTDSLLELQQHYNVNISHIEQTKSNIIWIQDKDNESILLDIYKNLNEKENPVAQPEFNKLYCAEDEGAWFRCRVTGLRPLRVFFIDFGNAIEVKEVREIPDEMKTIPAQAIRMSFLEKHLPDPKIDQELRVMPTQHFEDGTYFCHIKPLQNANNNNKRNNSNAKTATVNGETKVTENPTIVVNDKNVDTNDKTDREKVVEKVDMKTPNKCVLENGIRIAIALEFDERFIVRTKENMEMYLNIQKIIKDNEFPPLNKVSVGQLVLAQKLHEIYFSRAVVESINGKMVTVKFLDFYNVCETVPETSLKAIDEKLATMPITIIETPKLKGFTDKKFNEKCKEFIEDCIVKRKKFNVVLADGIFDLVYVNIKDEKPFSLSEKLLSFYNQSTCVMLNDLDTCVTELGEALYTVYLANKMDSITLIQETESVRNYLENVFIQDLDDSDNIPYRPVIGEVCLAKFEEAWFRSAICSESPKGYMCYFIDFGNEEVLTADYLRKLPDNLKSIPILGIKARLVGIEAGKIPALRETIPDGETLKVNVLKLDGERYNVELPDAYSKV